MQYAEPDTVCNFFYTYDQYRLLKMYCNTNILSTISEPLDSVTFFYDKIKINFIIVAKCLFSAYCQYFV